MPHLTPHFYMELFQIHQFGCIVVEFMIEFSFIFLLRSSALNFNVSSIDISNGENVV